jgi:hypothetical protein
MPLGHRLGVIGISAILIYAPYRKTWYEKSWYGKKNLFSQVNTLIPRFPLLEAKISVPPS